MPKVLEDRVKAMVAKGMDKSRAYAIATDQLQKKGVLKKGTQKLTRKGK